MSVSLYGDLTVNETRPKKLFNSSIDGFSAPVGCERTTQI